MPTVAACVLRAARRHDVTAPSSRDFPRFSLPQLTPVSGAGDGLAGNVNDFSRRVSVRWRERAACVHVDPELFFPAGYSSGYLAIVEEAKRVCASCEVSGPCLEFALSTHQHDGVWGGLTPDDRRSLQRRRQRQRRAAVPRVEGEQAS